MEYTFIFIISSVASSFARATAAGRCESRQIFCKQSYLPSCTLRAHENQDQRSAMKGGRKKRLTPKYTPPCPRVIVEPEGYTRGEDFEFARQSTTTTATSPVMSGRPRGENLHEEGEISRSPSRVNDDRFAGILSSIDELSRQVERASQDTETEKEQDLIAGLQHHLSSMQKITTEFLERLKHSDTEIIVGNMKHVLKTEEDVYNYFVR